MKRSAKYQGSKGGGKLRAINWKSDQGRVLVLDLYEEMNHDNKNGI